MNSTQVNEYALFLWTYVPPVVIIVGTTGNIFTILTVRSSKMTSFTVYLIALAVADTLVLYTQTLNLWFENVLKIKLKETTEVMCKLYYFFIFLCPQISSWFVMCLTIERTICMYFTARVRQFPGPKVGLTVVAAIVCFLCALNSHALYGREFVETTNATVCGFIDGVYMAFYYKYWNMINFIAYFVLPIVIIVLGNTATAIKVYRSVKSVTTTASAISKTSVRHVFLITLLVSVAFIILVTPLPLLFLITPVDTREFPAVIFVHMVSLNHAINFFLYVLSGRRFREDLKNSIKCCSSQLRRSRSALSFREGTSSLGNQDTSTRYSYESTLDHI